MIPWIFLEEISDYQSDPFAPHDLYFPANSCRIACTKIQNFEEEESCASIVSVDHFFESDIKLIGSDMILFRYDLIFLGLIFQIHNLSVLLVAVLINGVKKQVPQVSYKTPARDLIPFHSFGSILNLFRSLIYDIILFGSYFKIQIPPGLHAPKFRILKKKKAVHPPSRLTIYLDMT